ncbi:MULTISPECIES: NADPH-dependent FMN reductase [Maribacter]|uniref:NAD(P)H-dependent oxidoreductase n=1 Tax=Maribacter flavus TaxID=1658664 RepID=A0ABU7IGH5_9FLAO|nr:MULTISPECIES: NAD(P)H-dependent oxidoreductase [Maribacter]MDC6404638.1 NAD(P)H-dependent oxidoreductase [Maribacter sp. PR66]MEE1972050.1 NAD(P)H-dependent oxidoreductase [Maribacter flavus]
MKKIIAFAGSNNPASINQKLIKYIIQEFPKSRIEFLDLKKYTLPIYSQEIEQKGIPNQAKELFQLFTSAEGFILASPEHNGLPSAFLKNTIDWLSRIDQRFFGDKPLLLLSTSPGATGGSTHLEILANLVQRWGGQLVGQFSLGNFQQNFNDDTKSLNNSKEEYVLKNLVESFLRNQPVSEENDAKDVENLMNKVTTQFKSKGFL